MKKKVWKKLIIGSSITATVIMVVGLLVGNFFYNVSLDRAGMRKGKDRPSDSALRENSKLMEWLKETATYSTETLTTFDGLKVQGYEVVSERPSNKWIVLVHGYGDSANGMFVQAKRFHASGYNVLIPDARGHGLSDGDYIGMGWHERRDIVQWSNHIVAKNSQAEIVLYGVSMGAATVMMASGEADLPRQVRAIIEDCGYSSITAEFTHQLREQYHLNAFPVLNFASLVSRMRAGFWIGEGDVVRQVSKSDKPMLFIHGDADDYVPTAMIEDLYNAAKGPKEKLLVADAAHAKSLATDPELYWRTVDSFLAQHLTM